MKKVLVGCTLFLLVLLACSYVNPMALVKSQPTQYQAIIHITSPTQNGIYRTNNIPLNLTLSTNIPETDINYLVLSANLDGQLGYHDGNGIRLGEFKKPPSNYGTTINVSDGNHLLWVQVDIRYYSLNSLVENLSQIVSFTVNTGATTPAPTNNPTTNPTQQPTNTPPSSTPPAPSPTIPEFSPASTITMLAIAAIGFIFFKRRKSKTA